MNERTNVEAYQAEKEQARYSMQRHDMVVRLAEQGVTGRAARRKIAQAETRAARRGR